MNSYPINQYQEEARRTAKYPEAGIRTLSAIEYTVLGLCGESGEIANKVKKFRRDAKPVTMTDREELADEVGDVLWYVAMLADELGYTLAEIAAMNIVKLERRAKKGTIGGSGDKR